MISEPTFRYISRNDRFVIWGTNLNYPEASTTILFTNIKIVAQIFYLMFKKITFFIEKYEIDIYLNVVSILNTIMRELYTLKILLIHMSFLKCGTSYPPSWEKKTTTRIWSQNQEEEIT